MDHILSFFIMLPDVACLPSADNSFGPIVDGCRDDFDFTLKFEQCFFVVAPSAAMLLGSVVRLRHVQSRSQKLIDATRLKWTKLVSCLKRCIFTLSCTAWRKGRELTLSATRQHLRSLRPYTWRLSCCGQQRAHLWLVGLWA